MEAYSRRENLIITGIPESREDTGVEDTAKVLVDFMANELNVSNAADIDFQRVHRLGKPKDKGAISSGDQSVEKGDLIVTFNFDGERDVGVN